MSAGRCSEGRDWPLLLGWWFGELAPAEDEAFERHMFGCGSCARRLELLAGLGHGVAALAGRGRVFASLGPDTIARAEAEGLRLRRYRIEPGASVRCTIAPQDDANLVQLVADLGAAGAVDLEVVALAGDVETVLERLEDLPYEPASGELCLLYPGERIRPLPETSFRLDLRAHDGRGLLGSYTLHHSPWPA